MQKNAKGAICSILMLLGLFFCGNVQAQQKTISGNVSEANGEPIIGASVQAKGTNTGTITDFDGNYSISVPSDATTLIISYVGFLTQEVSITGNVVNVTLLENTTALDEVVVIGYGTAKKKDLTGAVSTLKGAELAKVPVTNVSQAMTGRIAGVQITSTDGSPDAEMIIRVRGGGSITGDNSPLYIVDGFTVSSISDVAPTDIEDITVLKDASSTAIYGSRGANGVVLITTKNAEGGKTKVSYNGYLQGKRISRKIDVMSPYDYVMFNYEKAALGMGNTISNFEKRYGAFDDLDLYKYQSGSDWQEEMFGNADLSHSHNISITGGSDKTKFNLSGTYVNDNSLMKDNGYNRFNLNVKLNHEIAKNLKIDFGARVADTETKGVGSSGGKYKIRSYDALMKAPVNGLYDMIEINPDLMSDEDYEQYTNETMSLQDKIAQTWRRKNERRFNFTGGATWNILKSLTYRLEGGYNYNFNQQKDWYGADSNTAIQEGSSLPMGDWTKRENWSYRVANTLTFNETWNEKHNVNLMLGQEVNVSGGEVMTMNAKFFQKDITPEKMFASMQNNSGEMGSRTISSSLSAETRMLSFFGRLNYNFDERYLLTFTFRADGSTKFLGDNRWGYFPAAAAAWRISQEEFMSSTENWLSNLKLRVSFGTSGNDRIANTMYRTEYKAYSSGKYYGAGGILNPHYTLNNKQLANPNLRWETTLTRNIGLDFGVMNERISGALDFYWNTVKDLLLDRKFNSIGYESMMENIGQTSNKGVELSLNAVALQHKDYGLNFNFNIGFNKNIVDKLPNGINYMDFDSGGFSTDIKERYEYRVAVGQPLGLIYGFVYDGIYGVDDFETYVDANGKTQFQFDSSGNYILKEGVVVNSYVASGGLRPGAMKLKDNTEDGKVDTNDREIIGRTAPKHIGGFGLDGRYKNFDISMMFNWVYGNQIYNMDKIVSTQSYRNRYANLRECMNPATTAWTYLDRQTGEEITDYETLKSLNQGKEYWSALTMPDNNPVVTSWAIEDGSYLRLQNITLGYTLPRTFTQKFACNSLRVYCTLNNVYTWTKYSGYDPEVNSNIRGSSSNGLTPGADFSSYPKSFSWTAGVNITF